MIKNDNESNDVIKNDQQCLNMIKYDIRSGFS